MSDAVRLMRMRTDIERLARGQTTTRAELTVQVLNPVIDDPDGRSDVWATKADAIVETYALPEISTRNRSRT